MKAPYRHITLFARQLDSKRKKTNRWRRLQRQVRRIMPRAKEDRIALSKAQDYAVREYRMQWCAKHGEWCFEEPIEEEAITFAASIRFFHLPWTLAISRSEAESCFIDLNFLSRFILDHFQLKLKITK